MKCFITLGKIDIKYILMISINIGGFYLIGRAFNLYVSDKRRYYNNYFENNKLLKSFMKYLGLTYLLFGELIRKKIVHKKGDEPIKNLIKTKDIIMISLVSFLFLLGEFLAVFLKIKTTGFINIDERYNSIEFIFLFLISLIIFKNRYYKHQYISILFIIIFEMIRYIIKPKNKSFFKQNYEQNNKSGNETMPYRGQQRTINSWYEFFFQIVRAIIDAIFVGYSKFLMEIKFFSPYKVTYLFGLICLVVILIIYIILSFISVEEKNKYNFIKYKGKYYIENLFSIFCDFTFLQFLGLFLYSISSGIYQFLYNFIIKDYTMCHFFLYYQFNAVYSGIVGSTYNKLVFSIIIISAVFELFITFVFLELIELNFWGLNKNIKLKIEERALLETLENNRSENECMPILAYNDDEYITTLSDENEQKEEK